MNDTIYRKDAIQALVDTEEIKGFAYRILEDRLMEIPSAERLQGEWIIHKINGIPHTAECSCCHNHYDYEDLRKIGGIKGIIALPYCSMCGCRMKGVGDETD